MDFGGAASSAAGDASASADSASTGLPPWPNKQLRKYYSLFGSASDKADQLFIPKGPRGRLDSISFRCMVDAQNLAIILNQPSVDSAHFLVALACNEKSQTILRNAGFDPSGALHACTSRLLPQPLGNAVPGVAPLPTTDPLEKWVVAAHREASLRGHENQTIEVRDFLEVLTDAKLKELSEQERKALADIKAILKAAPPPTIQDSLATSTKEIRGDVAKVDQHVLLVQDKLDGVDRKLSEAADVDRERHQELMLVLKTMQRTDSLGRRVARQRHRIVGGRLKALNKRVAHVADNVSLHRRETATGFISASARREQVFAISEQSHDTLKTKSEILRTSSERTEHGVQRLHDSRLSYAWMSFGVLIAIVLGAIGGMLLRP